MKPDADALRKLTGDAEFRRILADDPELARLRRHSYDRALESRVLLEVLGIGDFRIGKLPVRPLTIARIALLWMVGSPFVTGGSCSESDIDVALYILAQYDLRRIPVATSGIPAAAAGFRAATGLDPAAAAAEIDAMFRSACSPFALRPPQHDRHDKELQHDAEWASTLAGIAARESGIPFDRCLHEMSFSTAAWLYINYLRRESADGERIRRRPPDEIAGQIHNRVTLLAEEYLNREKGGNQRADGT